MSRWRRRHADAWAEHRHHGHRGPRTLRGTLMAGAVAAVVVTGAIVGTVAFSAPGSGRGGVEDMARAATFIARQPALTDVATRQALLDDAATAFDARLVLHAADGAILAAAGDGVCRHPVLVDVGADGGVGVVDRGGQQLEVCRPQGHGPPLRGLIAVGLVLAALAVVSSALARRIGRPLANLADTAWRIGQGDLTARPMLGRRPPWEIVVVGDALTEMAGRIERELQGQKALLAGASHELRTPLGHVRLQLELARARLLGDAPGVDRTASVGAVLDDIDSEISDIDALLEKLLASARLDFRTLDRRPLMVRAIASRALERAGLPASLLVVDDDASDAVVDADATLLGRAIGNLLENGASHGGGVTGVRVARVAHDGGGDRVVIAVVDAGPGVAVADRERIFEPFVHRSDRSRADSAGSLGLGLHLVRRIAEAHGGHVRVVDHGGSHFEIELPTVT